MGKIPRALAPPALATALLLCSGEPADASQDVASTTGALKHLSIEELMDIEVTSVSRAPETLSSAAAAGSVALPPASVLSSLGARLVGGHDEDSRPPRSASSPTKTSGAPVRLPFRKLCAVFPACTSRAATRTRGP